MDITLLTPPAQRLERWRFAELKCRKLHEPASDLLGKHISPPTPSATSLVLTETASLCDRYHLIVLTNCLVGDVNSALYLGRINDLDNTAKAADLLGEVGSPTWTISRRLFVPKERGVEWVWRRFHPRGVDHPEIVALK